MSQDVTFEDNCSYLETVEGATLSWSNLHRAIEKAKNPPSLIMRWSKAVMDQLAVACSLPIVLPLGCAIAVAIKLDSPGSVFFKQKRTGLNGQTFYIYKFRSMTEAAGKDETAKQSRKDDARHTRVGRFLRRTSLDELPQILNILRGEMSLVGPRPHARYHDLLFLNTVKGYEKRFRVKPGLTGLAQVSGCRGFIKHQSQIEDRTFYDNDYIDNWSLLREIGILFKTLYVVLKTENAH
jgi:putative colanic acid biosynthesis UDP-glucose lipid carrier transferase